MDERLARVRASVEASVAAGVSRYALWAPGDTLVAGFSGGADSLCLLGVLLALRANASPVAPGKIVVAHLDHGLRGEAGEADAAWVAARCRELDVPCQSERVDVAALARTSRRSLEDAARRARYAFLRRVAAEVGAQRIVIGHTRDDQVETLVMSWLRGSGLNGLTGMRRLAGDVARPLLDVSRAETEAYCAARGWQPRQDASNEDIAFRRNRIRHELLPVLERYNPSLRATLLRNAALLADDEAYLEASADRAWDAAVRDVRADRIEFALDALRASHPALRHRLFRRAARHLGGYDEGPQARHLAALDALVTTGTSGDGLDLPGRLRATREYATLVWTRRARSALPGPRPAQAPPVARDHAVPLPVPGVVELPELGWRVRVWRSENAPGVDTDGAPPLPAEAPALAHAGLSAELGRAELRVFADAEVAGETLWVRAWRPGDRFRPLGMRHEKKVQDYYSDAKVPRELRRRLPLIFNEEHVIWLAGQRLDDRARITPATRRVLVLQLEPL